jgi:hypothetical protein
MYEILGLFLFGMLGALVKDIVTDGKLSLPKCHDGELMLGCLGGMLVGGFVGYAVDHSFLTAALSGYVGVSAIRHLLPPVDTTTSTDPSKCV